MAFDRPLNWSDRVKGADALVSGIRVGLEVNLHIGDASHELIEAFDRVGKKGVSGDDKLPLGVSDRATDESAVGEILRVIAEEKLGVVDCTEGLVLAVLEYGFHQLPFARAFFRVRKVPGV